VGASRCRWRLADGAHLARVEAGDEIGSSTPPMSFMTCIMGSERARLCRKCVVLLACAVPLPCVSPRRRPCRTDVGDGLTPVWPTLSRCSSMRAGKPAGRAAASMIAWALPLGQISYWPRASASSWRDGWACPSASSCAFQPRSAATDYAGLFRFGRRLELARRSASTRSAWRGRPGHGRFWAS